MAESKEIYAPLMSQSDVHSLIQRRISQLTPEHRSKLPGVLRQDPIGWAHIDDGDWASIIFIDSSDQARISGFGEKGIQPFPGMITRELDSPAAFRLENSKFMSLIDCTVKNMHALSLGQDCSATLRNLSIELDIADDEPISYSIKLAFVVSSGKTIDKNNAINILEDLIAQQLKDSDAS